MRPSTLRCGAGSAARRAATSSRWPRTCALSCSTASSSRSSRSGSAARWAASSTSAAWSARSAARWAGAAAGGSASRGRALGPGGRAASQFVVVGPAGRRPGGQLGHGEVLVVADGHALRRAGEHVAALRARPGVVRRELGALGLRAGGHVLAVDVQPRRRSGARERGVAPAARQGARRGHHGGVLDGPALHAVPGQAVGVLDVLGDVGGGQRPQRPGVGLDQQALRARLEHRAARAVVDVGEAVVAAVEDWRRAVGEHGIAQAVLIARDNDTRAALNAAAREHVRAQGQLGDDVDYGPVTVAVGDRIICRRNDRFADAGLRQAGGRVLEPFARRVVERGGGLVVADGRVRDVPVIGQPVRPREGILDGDDMRLARDLGERHADLTLGAGPVEPAAEHERDLGARLRGEPLLEQVLGLLRLGSRNGEVVLERPADGDRSADDGGDAEQDEEGRDAWPAASERCHMREQ